MMMKSKALCSKFSRSLIAAALLMLAACDSAGQLYFCEKPDDEKSEAKNCGKVFTIGQLRLVVKARQAFKKKKLLFKLYDMEDTDKLPEEVIEISVDEEATAAHTDIELYDAGKYRVEVETVDGKIFGKAEVTLIEE